MSTYTPPDDVALVPAAANANIGWLWNDGDPVDPNPPPEAPPRPDLSNPDAIEAVAGAILLAAAAMSGRDAAQAKAAYKSAWDQKAAAIVKGE